MMNGVGSAVFDANLQVITEFGCQYEFKSLSFQLLKMGYDAKGQCLQLTKMRWGDKQLCYQAVDQTARALLASLIPFSGDLNLYRKTIVFMRGIAALKHANDRVVEFEGLGPLLADIEQTLDQICQNNLARARGVVLPSQLRKLFEGRLQDWIDRFGENRIKAICSRYPCFNFIIKPSTELTCEQMRVMLLMMGDVRLEDVAALFYQIKGGDFSAILQGCPPEQLTKLQTLVMSYERVEELTHECLDALFEVLIPFATREEIFLGQEVVVADQAKDSGKTLVGMSERVRLYHDLHLLSQQMRQKRLSNTLEKIDHLFWPYLFLKRVVDREPPEGTIITHPDGYYTIHRIIHGGGAYKILLKTFSGNENFNNCIVCRGTRATPTATDNWLTLAEDLRSNVGSLGPQVTYQETLRYLTDPTLGYVRNPIEKINWMGFSLGGLMPCVTAVFS